MSDLISRHKAIDIVRNIIVKEVTPAYMLIDKAEVMTELMMMPPAKLDLQPTCNNLVTDCISRQEAIDVVKRLMGDSELSRTVQVGLHILPSVQPDLTYIIFETLAECGLYGEEATIKLIGTLKRLGRNDLLPSCVR